MPVLQPYCDQKKKEVQQPKLAAAGYAHPKLKSMHCYQWSINIEGRENIPWTHYKSKS